MDTAFYAFVFAVQRPFLVCFARMHRVLQAFQPAEVTSANLEELAKRRRPEHFPVERTCLVFDARFQGREAAQIGVVNNMQHTGNGMLRAHSDEVPLQTLLAALPTPDLDKEDVHVAPRPPTAADEPAKAAARFPWLHKYLQVEPSPVKASVHETAAAADTFHDGDEGSECDEDVALHSVFEALREKRAEVLPEHEAASHFPVSLLGGA